VSKLMRKRKEGESSAKHEVLILAIEKHLNGAIWGHQIKTDYPTSWVNKSVCKQKKTKSPLIDLFSLNQNRLLAKLTFDIFDSSWWRLD